MNVVEQTKWEITSRWKSKEFRPREGPSRHRELDTWMFVRAQNMVKLTVSHSVCSRAEGRWHRSFAVFQIHRTLKRALSMQDILKQIKKTCRGSILPVLETPCPDVLNLLPTLSWHSWTETLLWGSGCMLSDSPTHLGPCLGVCHVPEEFVVQEVVGEEELQNWIITRAPWMSRRKY